MHLAIMQPYIFPYLGYFSLIAQTDTFILLDEVQYIRHGWINRNRILKPDRKDWQYFNIPLIKHSRGTLIKDTEISYNDDWKKKILGQLSHYKKKSPFYADTLNVIEDIFSADTSKISNLNKRAIELVCDYIGISHDIRIFSEMNLSIDTIKDAGDWALNISKAMNAQSYLNPIDGKEIFDAEKFVKHNIDLKFSKVNLEPYSQRSDDFVPGLSIIDLMMAESPENIKSIILNAPVL